MPLISDFAAALGHSVQRLVVAPRREKMWRSQTANFVHTTPENLRFNLNPDQFIDRYIFIEGIYERRLLDAIKRYFRKHPGHTAIDVGANIGNHSIYLAGSFKRVICFDPNPIVVARLKENVALNRLSNVEVEAVGLSDTAARLPFEVNAASLGSSGFVAEASAATIELPVEVGDEYLERLQPGKIDFIKVDVENHERAVLAGLRKTIERHRPIVAFEFHAAQMGLAEFEAITANLPRYIFAEPHYAPPSSGLLAKFSWQMKHHARPDLRKFARPELRSYESILAFPDQETFDSFAA